MVSSTDKYFYTDISQIYEFFEVLGEGSFSKVYKAKFDGAVFSVLSCTLHELDTTGRSIYCLNKRIVEDGYATGTKDNSIVSV